MYSKQVLHHRCYFIIQQLAFWNYLQTALSGINWCFAMRKQEEHQVHLLDWQVQYVYFQLVNIEIHVGDADCTCPKTVYGSSLAVFHKRFSFQPYYILIHTFRRVLTNSLPTCDQMFETGLEPMTSVVGDHH